MDRTLVLRLLLMNQDEDTVRFTTAQLLSVRERARKLELSEGA